MNTTFPLPRSPFQGGGNMGAMMRALDWSRTPLGGVDTWPQSLHTALEILLDSGYPMYIAWGPHYIQFYNDAYRPILGTTKHPAALGDSTYNTFAEIWEYIGPMFQAVMDTGTASTYIDQLLPMDRNGFIEECYFTFSYSAIREAGRVGGVFVTVLETTDRVLRERRENALHALAAITARGSTTHICKRLQSALNGYPEDLPFAVFHSGDEDGTRIAPVELAADLADAIADWQTQYHRLGRTGIQQIELRRPLVLPPWPEPIERALVLPITLIGQHQPELYLLVGLSPRLAFDSDYEQFVQRVGTTIATTLSEAESYEAEHRRAEALQELDRAKTTFFSNVSHEFRTPLTLMLAPLQQLQERRQQLPEDLATDLGLIHRNAQRLQKLVNNLLDFARIEAGRIDAVYEPVDLAKYTTELASLFESAMHSAGLSFCVLTPDRPCIAYVDRAMWEKILFNFLSNALKFTFTGEVRVELKQLDGEVELSVQDTGVGIPADELPRVFERFHRVQGTRSRTFEGTGIGLALAKELVNLHHGEIEVESAIDRGTRIRVRIPLGTDHLPPDRIGSAPELESTALNPSVFLDEVKGWLSNSELDKLDRQSDLPPPGACTQDEARILLADDNRDMRDYVGGMLARYWTVEVVKDGIEALDAIRRQRPDLVITDMMMPNLDGFGLLSQLREDPQLRTLPVIMLSARAGEESRIEGLNRGADDYLVKPFSARELNARVETQLLRARVREIDHQLNRRLADVFRHAPVGLALLRGEQYIFDYVNTEYVNLVPHRDLLGRPVREVFPELESQGFFKLLDECYRSGEPYIGRSVRAMVENAEHVLEERYFDFAYQPTRGGDGRITGIAIIVFEVTAIAQARLKAETASRAKDDFFAILGHELRNPLAPILTALQLMQLSGDDSFSKERAIIDRQARYLVRLIEDLLDISRISRGDINLNVETFDIRQAVDLALETVTPLLDQRRHSLSVELADTSLPVRGDTVRLSQIMANLLTNAARYTQPGGRIRLTARRDADQIRVEVIDNGIGIAPDKLSSIFERFVQIESKTHSAQGGLGLGLAIASSLARQHGGQLQAHSDGPGRGSRFELTLPAAQQEELERQSRLDDQRTPLAVGSSNERGIRTLIVDDNRDAADMLAYALTSLGHATRVAYDGPSALKLVQEFTPDVALLDIGLPVMNGHELGRRLRGRPELDGLYIVALTGYGQEHDRRQALDAGFDEHLVKPVDIQELDTLLRKRAPERL